MSETNGRRETRADAAFWGGATDQSAAFGPVRVLADLKKRSLGILSKVLQVGFTYRGRDKISDPYTEDVTSHAALKTFANAVRVLPLRFYRTDPVEDPKAQAVENTALDALFKRPNRMLTRQLLLARQVLFSKAYGGAYWILLDERGQPVQGALRRIATPSIIHIARRHQVEPQLDDFGVPVSWKVQMRRKGEKVDIPAHAVVVFPELSPYSLWEGIGEGDILRPDLNLSLGAKRYQQAILDNSGDPGGYVIIDEEITDDDEVDEKEREINAGYGPAEAGKKKLIVGKGVEVVQNKMGPKDMEWHKLLTWNRDGTASIFGVPLPLLGVLDRATFNNFETAVEWFWKGGNGVLAWVRAFEDLFRHFFVEELADPSLNGLYPRFDLSGVEALQEDMIEKANLALKLASDEKLALSWNEAAALVGLQYDAIETWGDLRLTKKGTVTVERMLEDSANPPEPVAPPAPGDEGGEPDPDPEPDDEPDDGGEAAIEPTTRATRISDEDELDRIERADYWRGIVEDVISPGEVAVRRTYQKVFRPRFEDAQLARLAAFAERGPDALAPTTPPEELAAFVARQESPWGPEDLEIVLVNAQEWEKKLAETVGPDLDAIFAAGAKSTVEEIGGALIDAADPEVIAFLEQQRILLAGGHVKTLREGIRSAILRVLTKNAAIGTLQETIADLLPEIEGELRRVYAKGQIGRFQRALAIARTETAHAANGARFLQMQRSGTGFHEWVDSDDGAVRHSHRLLDGTIVRVGEPFKPGLRYPNDPSAPAGEVINCRCITRPRNEPKP